MRRRLLFAALTALFLLHNDLWLWEDPRRLLGLPAGLLYHLGYCLAAAAVMALAVRFAWPAELEEGRGSPAPGDAGSDAPAGSSS